MAKVIPISERFQHFVEELQESFWGDLYGRTRQAWKKFFELESERLRDRYAVATAWTRSAEARRISQRVLRARFGHGVRHHPVADCTGTGKELSAARGEAVPAPRARAGDADPGSLSARAVDAASGPGGEHADRGSGERADGVAADSRPG